MCNIQYATRVLEKPSTLTQGASLLSDRDVRTVTPLPVDAILPAILASLKTAPNLVIEAQPGAGKTTHVPRALLHAVQGEVLVLEPRRIAARLAARRVAWEMEEEVGQTVGYQVRYERVTGPQTRLHFITEGVLTRRLFTDPLLKDVDAVILDEFHERHLDSDLALSLLRRLQTRRPELHILVMSATLEAASIARFLGDCSVLRSEGRLFDLQIEHLPYSPEPLEMRVAGALERLLAEGHNGDTLVFLPGAAEIRKALRAMEPIARKAHLLALPLHGDLDPMDQDRVVAPSELRKVIVATNVAESSITIDGVTAVIDSGLARIASYSHWTGLPTLEVGRISKASAKQRAGRAGRTGPGRVLRLYSQQDFSQRPEQDAPEIARADLAQFCLSLRAMNILDPNTLQWLDAPPEQAVRNAEDLLDRLGADTKSAQAWMRFPLHPRLSRVMTAALDAGAGEDACRAAALLGSNTRRDETDLLEALDQAAKSARNERFHLQLRQLRSIARPAKDEKREDESLLKAVLAGFPDRVARRKNGNQIQLANGIVAEVAGNVPQYALMTALEIEDRTENAMPLVRLTARVEPEWLLDFFPDHMREETRAEWNRKAERVDAVSRLYYDELVLEESLHAVPNAEDASALLAEKAWEAGIERFVDADELAHWVGRLEFADFDAPPLDATLRELCIGLRSFAELRAAAKNFLMLAEQHIDAHRLRELAPLTLRLAAGRQAKIQYERGKEPWIASRLQDFFGMKETPRIGPQKTPLVLHLLAPNHRSVQTTTDLAGFWQRLYPQVRRELMRRYPRHAWPEQGA